MGKRLKLYRNGAVSFIDWLDAVVWTRAVISVKAETCENDAPHLTVYKLKDHLKVWRRAPDVGVCDLLLRRGKLQTTLRLHGLAVQDVEHGIAICWSRTVARSGRDSNKVASAGNENCLCVPDIAIVE